MFQTAFEDDRIIPFERKGTAINIIVLVSKTVTIGAPFVNELDEPIPIVVVLCLAVLTLVVILFAKSKAELDKMVKMNEVHNALDKMEKEKPE